MNLQNEINTDEIKKDKDRAVLIGLDLGDSDEENSIEELERLADTAGIETVFKSIQKREIPDTATFIGAGKAKEIAEICKNNDINLAIVDEELKGSQIRELEEILDIRVIDRTTLILDIFAQRANSMEGRLQVELAQYKYRLPRLTGMGKALSRLGGGIGTRGPGETQLETDRRHIKRRISHIEDELRDVEKRRNLSRQSRKKKNIPIVALVGYTNAGKSSLMNKLCENAEVYVKDQLFATLDPTIRRLQNNNNTEILLVDTVGFIRKLPHDLIDAFKSTLEESLNADLLLHVVDYHDEDAEKQIETVNQILGNLQKKGENKPVFLVFNKCDLMNENTNEAVPKATNVPVFIVSAETSYGLEELKKAIIDEVTDTKEHLLIIPYSDGQIVNLIHNTCKIISETHEEDGTHLRVILRKEDTDKYKKYIS